MKTSLKRTKIQEAKRYFKNAKNELTKAKLKDKHYQDNKYVRSSGDFAWKGVLFATEYLFENLNIEFEPQKKGRRMSVNNYNNGFNVLKRKNVIKYTPIKNLYFDLYEVLHKSMGYDGITDSEIINLYLKRTQDFLSLIENLTNEN